MNQGREGRERLKNNARYSKAIEIGDKIVQQWDALIAGGYLNHYPEVNHMNMVYPRAIYESYNFCVVCGKQNEYRINQHLLREHPELFKARTESDKELMKERMEMIQQLCRGVTQYMANAKVNLRDIPAPRTLQESLIYDAFKRKLSEAGIPYEEEPRQRRFEILNVIEMDEARHIIEETLNLQMERMTQRLKEEVTDAIRGEMGRYLRILGFEGEDENDHQPVLQREDEYEADSHVVDSTQNPKPGKKGMLGRSVQQFRKYRRQTPTVESHQQPHSVYEEPSSSVSQTGPQEWWEEATGLGGSEAEEGDDLESDESSNEGSEWQPRDNSDGDLLGGTLAQNAYRVNH